ncbi:hypothetical protein ACXGQW_09055 [Wenyingzhuangia sp. IMCC45533]
MKIHIYTTLLLFFCLMSCVEEIPTETTFEEQIFISGSINTTTDFVSVKIQKTVPVTSSNLVNFVSGANISLFTKDEDDKATLVTNSFVEQNGTYVSSEEITPVIGNSYWIEVTLENGTILKSDRDILRSSIEIKEIKKEVEEELIVVVFDDPEEESNFYIFHFEFFRDNQLVESFTELSTDRFFNKNEDIELSVVDDYIDEEITFKISISNVSFNTYQYHSNLLSSQEEDDVSLSSPINIIGNVTDTNRNKRSLGNFDVTGFVSLSKKF